MIQATSTATAPLDVLTTILTAIALGVVWNLGNVSIKKIAGGESMQWWRLGQAIAVGAVTGVLVSLAGNDLNETNLVAASGVAIPIVDKAINAARAGHRAGVAADDGDGQSTDELLVAINAALKELNGDSGSSPSESEPERQEGNEPVDDEPRTTQTQRSATPRPRSETESTTTERVESGP